VFESPRPDQQNQKVNDAGQDEGKGSGYSEGNGDYFAARPAGLPCAGRNGARRAYWRTRAPPGFLSFRLDF
jgi:hypothetical protein